VRGLTRDTIAELVDRKILWLFAVVTAIMLLVVYGSGNMRASLMGPGGIENIDTSMLSAPLVARALDGVLSFLVFLIVMASTGLLPRMLEKGRADFYLSKPNTRTRVLLGKLAAVWMVYGALMMICGLLVYGLVAIIHQTFSLGALYMFGIYLLVFFIWLAIVALAGVLFNSTVLAIMTAFVVWVAQTILSAHDKIGAFVDSAFAARLIDTLYYVFPKHGEIGGMAVSIASGMPVESWMPLWSSLLFGLAMLFLTVVIFNRRNY